MKEISIHKRGFKKIIYLTVNSFEHLIDTIEQPLANFLCKICIYLIFNTLIYIGQCLKNQRGLAKFGIQTLLS